MFGLVTSDAHAGLVEALGAALPGNQLAAVPHPLRRDPGGRHPQVVLGVGVEAMLHSVDDQPDAVAGQAQFDCGIEAVTRKLPAVAAHLEGARGGILTSTVFPHEVWRQVWSTSSTRG